MGRSPASDMLCNLSLCHPHFLNDLQEPYTTSAARPPLPCDVSSMTACGISSLLLQNNLASALSISVWLAYDMCKHWKSSNMATCAASQKSKEVCTKMECTRFNKQKQQFQSLHSNGSHPKNDILNLRGKIMAMLLNLVTMDRVMLRAVSPYGAGASVLGNPCSR